MATDFERLNIVLAARDREFARAMERNTRRVEKFARQSNRNLSKTSRSFSVVGMAAKRLGPLIAALGAGALIGKLKRTVSTLDDIGKTADKLGLTTDALQELRAVAESAGIAQGSLDSSLERFSKRIGEAALGTGAANKALKEMGISASDLATMGLDDALSLVADEISQIADPTERAARAAALFGREGVAMVNLMREGSAGMEKMRANARDLGIVIDESLVRGAEDAQTKLDLMSRVISAQLNSALIELAPLLVGGATAVADFARGLVSAINNVKAFMDPQSALENATENLVTAMGDEIRQSQLLETALGRGINLSVTAAKEKLDEATARHENVKAIIAERKALALGSDEFADLTKQIADANSNLNAQGFPAIDVAVSNRADAFEAEQLRLVDLIKRRQALLKTNAEMDAQLARSGENIAALQNALDNSSGGVVSVTGDYISPLENSPKQEVSSTGGAAAAAIPDLSDYADVMARINAAFGDVKASGDGYADTMAKLQVLLDTGEISADEYANAVGALEGKFKDAASGAAQLEGMAASAAATIVTDFKNAGDAVSNLLGQLAKMAAQSAFSGVFGGSDIFKSLAPIFTGASFDGGGYTGGGARSGGLDGKGGFMAMMHPQESVIDHTKGQSVPASGGGGAVQISVSVSGARGNSEITEMVQSGVRQGLQEYDRIVLPRSVQKIQRDPRRIG